MVNEQTGDKVGKGFADADSGLDHSVAPVNIRIRNIQRHILLSGPFPEAESGKPVVHPEDGIDQSGLDVLLLLPFL
ncbi:hypothetical protein D3C80_1562700 [compost metagenome]